MVKCPDLNRYISEGQTAVLIKTATPVRGGYTHIMRAFIEAERTGLCELLQF
jgi:hypothetical protein